MHIARIDPSAIPALSEPLTALLHRSYAGQVAMGLRPLAGRQTPDITVRRCTSGETFVARLDGTAAPAGMVVFEEIEEAAFPMWFLRPEVSHFSLLAVDPELQGQGIGARLIDAIERRAGERGFRELSLSMAEPDARLLAWYRRQGFRFIEYWRWPYTNYRSVIMSRSVAAL